jgi:hypothetical protein
MRKLTVLWLLLTVMALGLTVTLAQEATPAADQFASNVAIFYVACDNRGIVNLTGTMEPDFDVYFTLFSGPDGTGTPLTSLRQAVVDGAYAFSEAVNYNAGSTVNAGQTGSVVAFIAREGRPTSGKSEEFRVNDIQDGCNNAQNALGTSVDTGVAGAVSGGGAAGTTSVARGANILSPFGGVLNPGSAALAPEPPVVIGARRASDVVRGENAGVVFAECNQYLPGAAPGVIYDTDNVRIFWLWFARTEAQVQEHLAAAQYDVRLNGAPLVDVGLTAISRPNNRNFYVFYVANIGNLTPGQYGIEFNLSWSGQIFDGFARYGPGTDRESTRSTCDFTIQRDPTGRNPGQINLIYSLR